MIWLIGNHGMLGSELSENLGREGIEFYGTDRDISILDEKSLADFAAGKKIDWIVNCAAYTAVDKAEDEAEFAHKLNAEGPENIGKVASAIEAKVLHISTDYVFGGLGNRPLREDDPIAPETVYGRTKAEGEARLLAVHPDSVIIRTAWLYGKHGANFVYTMLRLMKERDSIGVVSDQQGIPTWARDLSDTIIRIIKAPRTIYGIFHFTDGKATNWYEFTKEIERLGLKYGILQKPCKINALSTDQYPSKAKRPAYSVLSKEKIKLAYGIDIPDWNKSLEKFFCELAADKIYEPH